MEGLGVRSLGKPVLLGEDGHLLALAEADSVGGATTGGAGGVDVDGHAPLGGVDGGGLVAPAAPKRCQQDTERRVARGPVAEGGRGRRRRRCRLAGVSNQARHRLIYWIIKSLGSGKKMPNLSGR
jgi:hypothetical protein